MELHTAVDRVSKFVAKTKGAVDVLKRIRFFPAGRDTAAHVYGTDGQVGVVIPVDVDVPDMALDASSLTALMRDPISQVYMDPGATVPTVIFRSKSGAGYAILHQASTGHPMFPDYPTELTTIPAWDVVQKSFHAALPPAGEVSGNPRPDLECVHFAEGRVEATDSYRIVITDVETGLRGRVPVSVFRYWPKRVEVASVFTDTHAWFRAGEEMRFVQLRPTQPGPNRDLREQFVPLHHDGPWMVVPSKRFHGVVKKAVKTSPLDQVVLRFGVWGVDVKAEQPDGNFEERIVEDGAVERLEAASVERVEGQVGLAGNSLEYPTMVINGKFLDASLRCVSTPNVRLCYGGAASPLRIESGGFVEALWPKLI